MNVNEYLGFDLIKKIIFFSGLVMISCAWEHVVLNFCHTSH